ncbi:hypothetical protein MY1_1018 [Nitrosarchaeum koreense MY1]|uniref:Uncharacterized protein n=1 Tax=Nitrosarchaeum koreense MY1 TaxID=1001994 RepID=F9CWX6_9ARCH|nr:hypothetical protein MY1_1018 [Nitrosarchaeum koreense MY1]
MEKIDLEIFLKETGLNLIFFNIKSMKVLLLSNTCDVV